MHTPNLQPPPTSNSVPQLQATNNNGPHNRNPPAPQTMNNSAVQQGMLTFPFYNLYLIYLRLDESHGDSSDGLRFIYYTESEKWNEEVTESWKADIDGILIFVSLAQVYHVRIHHQQNHKSPFRHFCGFRQGQKYRKLGKARPFWKAWPKSSRRAIAF